MNEEINKNLNILIPTTSELPRCKVMGLTDGSLFYKAK